MVGQPGESPLNHKEVDSHQTNNDEACCQLWAPRGDVFLCTSKRGNMCEGEAARQVNLNGSCGLWSDCDESEAL